MKTKTKKKTTAKAAKKKFKAEPKKRSMRTADLSDEVDIDLGDFDIKKVKAKTTIYLDGDVWDKLHDDAEKAGMKYQPFLNQLLRRVILHEKSDIEIRLERLESVVLKNKAI